MRTLRLLLVDDEVQILHALERTFASEGYAVYTATDAQGALEVLESEEIDMVISDHRMPAMTGTHLLRLVRQRYPWVLRVVLTGHADAQVARDAFEEAGSYRVLAKPWDNAHLRAIVRAAWRHLELQTSAEAEESGPAKASGPDGIGRACPELTNVRQDAEGNVVVDALPFPDRKERPR